MEIFKDIKGYEGRYQISNHGRVYSTPDDGKPAKFLKFGKTRSSTTTYYRVTLSKNGITKRFSVHRLVALHFLPAPSALQTVINHLDCDGTNNKHTNLVWCTQKENVRYAAELGNMTATKTSISQQLETKTTLLEHRCKTLFGDAFISASLNTHSTVTFHCACGNVITKRVDVAQKNPYCKVCHSKARSEQQKGHTNSKTRGVARFTLTGELVATYYSIAEARKATGDSNIISVAQGKYKQSKGHIWKYTN